MPNSSPARPYSIRASHEGFDTLVAGKIEVALEVMIRESFR